MGAMTRLPGGVKRLLLKMTQKRLGGYESRVRFGMIDWSGTQAYFEENPYYPAVYLNVKGRQPHGVVEPGPQYDEVRDRLIRELEAWRHPVTGEPMVQKAYRREEVYSGPHVSEAPDVVVHWALHKGYSYAFRLSNKSRKRAWLEQVDPNQPQYLPFFTGKSGHHRDDGIFLGQGPAVRAGAAVEGARIIDVAPTILHLLGVPVPTDMDGRVLGEILTEAAHQPGAPATGCESAPAAGYVPAGGSDSAYSAEDEATISERLQQMGYIE
jgi:predicted AlkP superfamily phosphohydrolase/phosphomutase